jgi:hypothetical protein
MSTLTTPLSDREIFFYHSFPRHHKYDDAGKPLTPQEIRTRLMAMKPRTWAKIRDELVARLPAESIKPSAETQPPAKAVG